MKALIAFLIILVLSGCGSTAEPGIASPTLEKPQTVTPTSVPSPTPTPDVKATQAAKLGLTLTAQVEKAYATKQAKSKKAEVILEEIRGAASEVEGLDLSDAKLVFGPESNKLRHIVDDKVKTYNPDLSLKNFIVSITFINPYDASKTGLWDYGLLFRNNYENNQYRFAVLSNQSWTLVDARTWTDVYSRNDKNLTAEAGEENILWLVVIDARAYLFINGVYVQALDVSAYLDAGDISPATGMYYGNEKDKKTTEFYDFTVWSLP